MKKFKKACNLLLLTSIAVMPITRNKIIFKHVKAPKIGDRKWHSIDLILCDLRSLIYRQLSRCLNMILFLVIGIISSLPLIAEEAPKDEETTELDVLKLAHARWGHFNKELDWFIAISKKDIMTLTTSSLKAEELRHLKKLKTELESLQKTFLDLRKKVCNVIQLQHGPYKYSNTLSIATIHEMTQWYTQYMEKLLFPENWEYQFEAYLSKKTKPSIVV